MMIRPLSGGRLNPPALAAFCGLALLIGCEETPKPGPRAPVALIQSPVLCADVVFPIYFESGSARLTREAMRLVAAAHESARTCDVHGIVVKGLAAGPGGADANLALSRRRAEAVTEALSKAGFSAIEFEVTAVGEAEPGVKPTGTHALRPRAEVRIHLVERPRTPGV